jgi:two-component system alkaline phosphatase synthesis response regulator PhoP
MSQKILLIDDDPAIIDIYSAVFKQAGYEYSMAINGQQGLDKSVSDKPDLILLDIMLPDISGMDVLTKIKSNPETASTPVWMLTNLGNAEIQTKAQGLGAEDFLAKAQNTPSQVLQKINSFFGNSTDGTAV